MAKYLENNQINDQIIAGSGLDPELSKLRFGLGEDVAPGGIYRGRALDSKNPKPDDSGDTLSDLHANHVQGGMARGGNILLSTPEPHSPKGITQIVGGSYKGQPRPQ